MVPDRQISLAIVLAGLLTVLTAEIWRSADDGIPPRVPQATPIVRLTAPAASSRGVARYAGVVLARPLFTAGRRPAPVRKSAGKASDRLPRLSGIVIAANGRRAIFDQSGKAEIGREGDRVGAYTIKTIGPRTVVVLGPEGQRVITISFDAADQSSTSASRPSILDQLNSGRPYPPSFRPPTIQNMLRRLEPPVVQGTSPPR